MKKTNFIINISAAAFVASVALTSCASNNVVLSEHAPVAIISVSSNNNLPWYDPTKSEEEQNLNSSGILTSMINNAVNASDPEYLTVQSRADEAEYIIRNTLEECGIEVLSPDYVLSSSEYKLQSSNFLDFMDTTIVADGYANISGSGTKRNRELAKALDAKSTLYAQFKFRKQKIDLGVWDKGAKAYVEMTITVAGEDGKVLLKKTYKALSKDYVPYKNGSWDKQGLCNLYAPTIEDVVRQFIYDFSSAEEKEILMPSVTTEEEDVYVYEGEATSITLPVNVTERPER